MKVLLPANLETYTAHYRQAAGEERITLEQAESLIEQLKVVHSVGSLIVVTDNPIVDKNAYYQRNTAVVEASDHLLAFQIDGSDGTQDTINKAKERGMPVKLFSYPQ